jgi:ubiquinone/menaquinone biosynthesis C-methylase UbiE
MPAPASHPQSFDAFAAKYDTAAKILRRSDFFVENLPKQRDTLLEVGCGTGLLAEDLIHHVHQITAIDISAAMLAIARHRSSGGNIEYRLCDVRELKEGKMYDVIVSHTTLHHLPDIPATLAKLRRMLNPGGRLIVVDCVRRFPLLRRFTAFHWAFAAARLPYDLFFRGPTHARDLWRFRVSREWIDHLKSDHYYTREEFRSVYAAALPGATFKKTGIFMGVVWSAPVD